MNEQLSLAIPEPATISNIDVVRAFTSRLEPWVDSTDDLNELEDVRKKVAAMEAYLRRDVPGTEAYAELARADRWLEVKIGRILGPPRKRGRPPQTANRHVVPISTDAIPPKAQRQFRQMGAHADEPPVKAAIERGASRAEVVRTAREVTPIFKGQPAPTRGSVKAPTQPRARGREVTKTGVCPACGQNLPR